jgi:hypothetical protein
MNACFAARAACRVRPILVATLATFPALLGVAQTTASDPPYSVVDSGPFYNVLQRTVSLTNNATGEISPQVQGYTELEDGMNYLSQGQWVPAQDLIEAAPAAPRRFMGK